MTIVQIYGTQRYILLYFKVELGSLCLGNKNVNRYIFFSYSGIFFFISDYMLTIFIFFQLPEGLAVVACAVGILRFTAI